VGAVDAADAADAAGAAGAAGAADAEDAVKTAVDAAVDEARAWPAPPVAELHLGRQEGAIDAPVALKPARLQIPRRPRILAVAQACNAARNPLPWISTAAHPMLLGQFVATTSEMQRSAFQFHGISCNPVYCLRVRQEKASYQIPIFFELLLVRLELFFFMRREHFVQLLRTPVCEFQQCIVSIPRQEVQLFRLLSSRYKLT